MGKKNKGKLINKRLQKSLKKGKGKLKEKSLLKGESLLCEKSLIAYCNNTHKFNCSILRKNSTKDQWLEDSKATITGNDVGGILGVSNYSSPLEVYLSKVMGCEEKVSEALELNSEMKDFICDKFSRSNADIKVLKIKDTLKSKYCDFATTKIDRKLRQNGESGVLHVKIASQYTKEAWEGENIPMEYYLKILWSLYVTGCKWGYYAVIVGGNTYIQKRVERNDDMIKVMLSGVKTFRENYILKGVLPNIDGEKTTGIALDKLYEREDNLKVNLGDEAMPLVKKREALKAEAKELNKYILECENKIKALMKKASIAYVDNKKITWRACTKSSLDGKALMRDYPDIHKKYLKETKYNRFEIKVASNM